MAHLGIQPLFAADEWQTIIGLLIFILWSAVQWLGARNEAKQQKQPKRPQPPQPVEMAEGQRMPLPRDVPRREQLQGEPVQREQLKREQLQRNQPQGNAPPPNQADALRSEVEEFLRRAQGKPPRQAPAQAERPPQRPVREQPQPEEAVRSLVKSGRDSPSGQPVRGETAQPPQKSARQGPVEFRNLRDEGVAEHVSRHLNTQDIADQSNALGYDIDQADERMESHLHERFDHDLGSLKHVDSSDELKLPAENMAKEIVAMFKNPAEMKKLIIANEILRRPEW